MQDDPREDVKRRLRRVEGQVRGVIKMLDDGRSCTEVIQQLGAIKAAVQQASLTMARTYACECLADESGKSQVKLVDDLIDVLSKAR
ncbi:MAG TPA: metal-sensitive transcriptional regulator [Anaerolineales bacterium]|jgi:DNA-binding FrmR family transcriptional regulator|nr:metal-sensitive transcriptional regulator [Anaerolineales bacterium]